jgi:L-lactate dehydrogenase complex protein LldF
MGIVLTTLLDGMERAHPLLEATTLCGACGDVCPVKVPLPHLLHRLREQKVEMGLTARTEQVEMAGFGLAAKSPFLFHLGQTAARALWPMARRFSANEVLERMPVPAERPFRRRFS